MEISVTSVGTSGSADGKAPLCLGESVTPKGSDGLTAARADGKHMQIFGSNEINKGMIGLKKISEEPIEIKLVFVRDDIRHRRFSTTSQIHSCGLEGKASNDALFRN
jgi:hypothetical protein